MKFLTDVTNQKISIFNSSIFESAENSFLKLEEGKMNLQKIGLKTVRIIDPAEVKNVNLIIGLPTGIYVNCILNHFTEADIKKFKVKVSKL